MLTLGEDQDHTTERLVTSNAFAFRTRDRTQYARRHAQLATEGNITVDGTTSDSIGTTGRPTAGRTQLEPATRLAPLPHDDHVPHMEAPGSPAAQGRRQIAF